MIRHALFDLDDTLYPPAAGLMRALSERFTRQIVEALGLSPEEAEALRVAYARRYGSTTRGLVLHHGVDVKEFLAAVHDLPVEDYLGPDPELACLLDCLHAEKSVFTNAPEAYAARVLEVLGVRNRFRRVFALEFSDYRGKPDPATYAAVREALGVPDRALVMLDDARANLAPAAERGWTTVWVNGHGGAAGIDHVVGDLWGVAHVFHEVGVLDRAHRDEWHRCLARCPLGGVGSAGKAMIKVSPKHDPGH